MKSSPLAHHVRNGFELWRLWTSILSVALSFVKYLKIEHRITINDWSFEKLLFILVWWRSTYFFSVILRVCFPVCNRKKIMSIAASFTKFFDLRVPSHFECLLLNYNQEFNKIYCAVVIFDHFAGPHLRIHWYFDQSFKKSISQSFLFQDVRHFDFGHSSLHASRNDI